MRKLLSLCAAMLFAAGMMAEPVVLPATLDVTNVSFRSEGMPDYIIADGEYAGTYFDMGAHDSSNDTLLYAEWDVTIQPIKYNIAVDVYNENSWRVQLYILNQAGDTVKDLRYKGSSGQCGQFAIGALDLSDLEAGDYKVRARAATAWSKMKLKDVIFEADYSGATVNLPGALTPEYAELFGNASIANGAIAFKPSTANTDYATWNVTFIEEGEFEVILNIEATNGHNYGIALLSADGETEIAAVNEGGQNNDTGFKELGAITVPAAGDYKVKLTNSVQWSEAVVRMVGFALPAPADPEYFLVGSMNEWTNKLNAYKFVANPSVDGEFMFTTTLALNDEFKVKDDAENWYPDGMGNNFVVTEDYVGEKTIYFRPAGSQEGWHGGFIYVEKNVEPIIYCEQPQGHLGDPNFGDANGRILLTIQKVADSNDIRVAIKNNTAAGNTKEGLNFLWVNAEGATGGVVRYGNGTHDEADVEEVSVIVPFDAAKETYNFINIHWAYAGWEGEWAIDGLTVKADELCPAPAPQVLEDGYYLIGDPWTVESIAAEDKFAPNGEIVGEFVLNTTLTEGDQIKVVAVAADAIIAWYPEGYGTEYTVDQTHAGEKAIYFRPAGNEDAAWQVFGGFIYIEANTTGVEETNATVKAVKVIENGQLVIIKNGVRLNILGTQF